jgi:hypothetical protein
MDKVYHSGYMSKLKAGQQLDSYFWADSSVHVPYFALFSGVSIVLYTRKYGECRTTLYEFWPEIGRVQIHDDVLGFVPPCRRAVLLHYNGVNHYEAVDLQENIRYSPLPAPAASTAETAELAQFLLQRKNNEISRRRKREA